MHLPKPIKLYSTKNEPCSTTYGEREIQIKTIMSHHYNPIRMAKIQTHTAANAGEEMEQQRNSHTLLVESKWSSHLGREFGVSCKTKHPLTI